MTFDPAETLRGQAEEVQESLFTADSYAAFQAAVASAETEEALRQAKTLLVQSNAYPAVSVMEQLEENYYTAGLVHYAVGSAAELQALATLVEEKTVPDSAVIHQTADLDLSGYANLRIGVAAPFAATYDGGSYTIRNYKITDGANYTALFPKFSGTLKNLIVENASVRANTYSGVVVGNVFGTQSLVENVHVKNSTFEKTANGYGGAIIVGQANSNTDAFTVRNCTVSGCSITESPTATSYNAGFVVGKSRNAGGLIENCYAWDNTYTLTTQVNVYSVGGILGEAVNTTVKNCGAYNNTYSGANLVNLGGVVGQGIGDTFTMEGCYTDMDVAVSKVTAPTNTVTNNYVSQSAADIESGKLAYTLKGDWVQTNMPMVAEGQESYAVTLEGETETKILYTDARGLLIGTPPAAEVWKYEETYLSAAELTAQIFTADATLKAAAAKGDLDGNGTADSADAVILLQYLVGYDVTFRQNADLNADGRVSIYDAVVLLRELSK